MGKVVSPMNGYIFYEQESPMQYHEISKNITLNQSIEKLYKRKICFMPFSSSESFEQHLRKHIVKRPLLQIVAFYFTRKNTLVRSHINVVSVIKHSQIKSIS